MDAKEHLEEIIKDYKSHKKLSIFLDRYYQWKKSFSIQQRWYLYEDGVKFLEKIGENELAYNEWKKLQIEEFGNYDQFTYRDGAILRLSSFEKSLNKGLVDSFHIHKIAFKGSQLTKFGLRNKSQVFQTLDIHIKAKYEFSFFEDFWIDYKNPNCGFKTFGFHHYLPIFKDSDKKYIEWEKRLSDPKFYSIYVRKDGSAKDNLVFESIRHRASELLREAENLYRANIGAKQVGESWISETELYYLIKSKFNNNKVIHHGRPEFLGRQHLDIWIPELKIGIEFHGAQHDRPIEFFGGEISFLENQKRDERKRNLCLENGVRLIEVREGYDIDSIIQMIIDIQGIN
jgi:hypothetical protein